jgi:hypothetical protein
MEKIIFKSDILHAMQRIREYNEIKPEGAVCTEVIEFIARNLLGDLPEPVEPPEGDFQTIIFVQMPSQQFYIVTRFPADTSVVKNFTFGFGRYTEVTREHFLEGLSQGYTYHEIVEDTYTMLQSIKGI